MTGTRKGLFVAGGVVLAFLVGFGWQFARAHSLQGQLDQAQRELTFQRMEATLGAATIEAQRGGFEPARQLASDFFTRLQAAAPQAPSDGQAQLQRILSQRDQVITQLSRGDAQAGPVLANMFVSYRVAVGESSKAPPGGTEGSPGAPPAAPSAPAPVPANPSAAPPTTTST